MQRRRVPSWRGPTLVVLFILASLTVACDANSSPDRSVTGGGVVGAVGVVVGAGGGVVTSPDGTATLSIPAGALAADAQITIMPLPLTDWPAEVGGLPLTAYRLQPSGLRFDQVAHMNIRIPVGSAVANAGGVAGGGDRMTVPIAVGRDGSTLEELSNSLAVDLPARTANLDVEVRHFSDVFVPGFFDAEFDPPTVTTQVGSPPWKVHLGLLLSLKDPGMASSTSRTGIEYRVAYVESFEYSSDDPPVATGNPKSHAGRILVGADTVTTQTLDDAPPTFSCLAAGAGSYVVAFRYGTHPSFGNGGIHIARLTGKATCQSQPSSASTAVSSTASTAAPPLSTVSESVQGPGSPGPSRGQTATTPASSASVARPGAITAYFVQSAFSTYYQEPVTGPGWAYLWSIDVPADPGCAKGFHASEQHPNEAVWYHANTTEKGPCTHSDKAYNDTVGHVGTITLVVTPPDRTWRCEMIFVGSAPNDANRLAPAVGHPPQCQEFKPSTS